MTQFTHEHAHNSAPALQQHGRRTTCARAPPRMRLWLQIALTGTRNSKQTDPAPGLTSQAAQVGPALPSTFVDFIRSL